jgi:hypothetical protein
MSPLCVVAPLRETFCILTQNDVEYSKNRRHARFSNTQPLTNLRESQPIEKPIFGAKSLGPHGANSL